MEISTIGLDLAQSIFQVHAINTTGETVVRKTLSSASSMTGSRYRSGKRV
jgi:transposase